VLAAGDACAVVESVKAASDVYSPLGGEVMAGNPLLATQPELINQDPYGQGWILRLKPTGRAADVPLDAAGYAAETATGA
jgi:glycine cleavage system H protein